MVPEEGAEPGRGAAQAVHKGPRHIHQPEAVPEAEEEAVPHRGVHLLVARPAARSTGGRPVRLAGTVARWGIGPATLSVLGLAKPT